MKVSHEHDGVHELGEGPVGRVAPLGQGLDVAGPQGPRPAKFSSFQKIVFPSSFKYLYVFFVLSCDEQIEFKFQKGWQN